MWRALFYVSFLSTCLAAGLAQDRALISGDSEDSQDVPVAGVQVTLKNASLRVERTTTTNADGYYFFAEVSPAEGYVITASAPGMTFAPQSVTFDVQVGETRHILPSFVVGKAPSTASERLGIGQPDRMVWLRVAEARGPLPTAATGAIVGYPFLAQSTGHSMPVSVPLSLLASAIANRCRSQHAYSPPLLRLPLQCNEITMSRRKMLTLPTLMGQFADIWFSGHNDDNTN